MWNAVRSLLRRRRGPALGAAALMLVLLGFGGYHLATTPAATSESAPFPQSAAMEDKFGVRFSRVAVVGDGGLIQLNYVVLDSEKASRFQSDVSHPPLLVSESRLLQTQRVSVMKQGHTLRAGQTYYLVYQNTHAALRSGEQASIVEADLRLPHVPVL